MSAINRAGLGIMVIAAMIMLGTALGADPLLLAVAGILALASEAE